jgi:hypothetical protein
MTSPRINTTRTRSMVGALVLALSVAVAISASPTGAGASERNAMGLTLCTTTNCGAV